MATEVHDFFVTPLCRALHDEQHLDTKVFEAAMAAC